MKTNKLFITALASVMLVGCADESLDSIQGNGAAGLNGKLVDAGVLAVGRGAIESEARAFSPQGNFVWMPTELDADGKLTEARKNQRVGFAWTGRNVDEPQYSAAAALSANVYTNYEYEHVGWLDKLAENPEMLECYEPTLSNGAYIKGEGTPEAAFGGSLIGTTIAKERYNKYYYSETVGAAYGSYTKQENKWSGELALSKGVFKTNNASVFEGEYLVYYPYTDAFTKGEIVAHMPISYDIKAEWDATNKIYDQDRYAAASDAAFAIGYIEKYKGGNSAAKLEAKTLNGFAVVRLANFGAAAAGVDKNIKTVILYSQSTGFIYSQELSAQACVTALSSPEKTLGAGTQLYTGDSYKKNVVYANLSDGTNEYITVAYDGTTAPTYSATKTDSYLYVALPVFPQTISDLQIILVDENDKTYTKSISNSVTFAPNKAEVFDINLYGKTFVNEYMVVDEATMWSAWEKIRSNGESNLAKGNKIKMLNDIKLEKLGSESGTGIYNSWFFDKNITITSDPSCSATLTLASGNEMSLKGSHATVGEPTVTFDVPVVVEGMGCCGNEVAVLVVGNKAGCDGKVVFNKDVTNHGTLVLNNNASQPQTIAINATLTNVYDDWAAAKNKKAGAAEIYILGESETALSVSKLVNTNGIVKAAATTINIDQIFAQNGAAYQVPADLHTLATAPTVRNVAATIGELVNDAEVEILSAAQVNVTTKLTNNTSALIKIVGDGHSTYDGRLDVKGTSSNKGVMDNTGVVNFTGASMDNDGLFIDRQSGQVGGKKVDNGTATGATKTYDGVTYTTDLPYAGIYVAQVETDERMSVVLGDAVVEPSTNIIEILNMDKASYNLETYEKNFEDKDVIINSAINIILESNKTVSGVTSTTESCFGHCVTVLANNNLYLRNGRLNTVKNMNVNATGKVYVLGADKSTTNPANYTTLTIGNDLNDNGTFTNYIKDFVVENDLKVGATTGKFVTDDDTSGTKTVENTGSFTVEGNVIVEGTFDSNGTDNVVKGNFTQDNKNSVVTFAYRTTTTIDGKFDCKAGKFEREGLNGSSAYRATVNVGTLGATNGTTDSAWPTEK